MTRARTKITWTFDRKAARRKPGELCHFSRYMTTPLA